MEWIQIKETGSHEKMDGRIKVEKSIGDLRKAHYIYKGDE